jgi:hypothetical protein
MRFYPLKGGEQFLLHYPQAWGGGDAFFGGMDESPFITPLMTPALVAHAIGGEIGFFEALTPAPIKRLKAKFPDACIRRQGDIWSIKLPWSWDELLTVHYKQSERKKNKIRFPHHKSRTAEVLGTEHKLTGKYYPVGILMIDGAEIHSVSVGEGTLRARDHADQVLEDGPYAFARTPLLLPIPEGARALGWE